MSNFQLRLTHKIVAIGAIGVLGLALVGLLYMFGTKSQTRYQKTAAEASALAASMKILSFQMLQARVAEKDFLLNHDDQYARRHGETVKSIAANFDDLMRRFATSEYAELAKQTAAARADYEDYVKHFTALADVQPVVERPRGDLPLERRQRRQFIELAFDRLEPRLVQAQPVERAGVELPLGRGDVLPIRLQDPGRPLCEQ